MGSDPADWARAAVSGVTSAIANSNKTTAPGDTSEATASAMDDVDMLAKLPGRHRKQAMELEQRKAQAAENEGKQRLALEKERNDNEKTLQGAQIAEAHAHEVNAMTIARDADRKSQAEIQEHASTMSQPFKDKGAAVLGEHLTSEEVQQRIKDGSLDPTQAHSFVDGYVDVLDKDGKPQVDPETGLHAQRPTFQLLSPVPQVTLNKAQADLLQKYAPHSGGTFTEGTTMKGETYYTLAKQAQEAQTVDLNVKELNARIDASKTEAERNKAQTQEANLTIAEKQRNVQARTIFAPYLAKTNGDPLLAIQLMGSDPKQQKNLGLVEELYGPGNLTKAREDTVKSLETVIEKNTKEIDEHSTPGATPLPADELKDLQDEIQQSRAMRAKYLGLSGNAAVAPPVPVDVPAVAAFKKDQQTKAAAQQKAVDDAARAVSEAPAAPRTITQSRGRQGVVNVPNPNFNEAEAYIADHPELSGPDRAAIRQSGVPAQAVTMRNPQGQMVQVTPDKLDFAKSHGYTAAQ
jgi:hypothetical protein